MRTDTWTYYHRAGLRKNFAGTTGIQTDNHKTLHSPIHRIWDGEEVEEGRVERYLRKQRTSGQDFWHRLHTKVCMFCLNGSSLVVIVYLIC